MLSLVGGADYAGISDLSRVVRIAGTNPIRSLARRVVLREIQGMVREGRNTLVDSYRRSRASATCASLYSLSGPGRHDLFRDVIVLKSATGSEQGVILLKYARTFDAMMALFEVRRLMERYVFVLEPCWAGYCDPSILMFVAPGNPVFVQCFTDDDHEFIRDVGDPLVPVPLGPADWVDGDTFAPCAQPTLAYDVVMVANWGRHKRHATLFRALSQIRDRDLRVLLIGFPWAGRTADDVRREAARIGNSRVQVQVLERLTHPEVASRVASSGAFVFLTKKEGDNKALVEALFADVPAIVYEDAVGGARRRINPATGVLTSDRNLAQSIRHVLDHRAQFSPRAWAVQNSGSVVATAVLNTIISETVRGRGGRYIDPVVGKVNAPNLAYKDPAVRSRFEADYAYILKCRRDRYGGCDHAPAPSRQGGES
jgi:glycosyltransferase involved in cell wall biosynthesis